jgi:uncharacterized protein YjbI with pentapeptide repeats
VVRVRQPPTVAPDVTRATVSLSDRLDEVDPLELGPRGDYELLHVADGDISRDLTGISFTDCLLERLTAQGAVLTGAKLVGTTLAGVNAPSLEGSRMGLQDVLLRESRLGAAEMYDCAVRGLVVEGCRIDFLNLRGSTLTDVLFRDCQFGDLDLGSVRADRVAFEDCRADAVDLSGARNRNMDLRGLQIGGLRSVEGLAGTTMSALQVAMLAPSIAGHLGIRLEE